MFDLDSFASVSFDSASMFIVLKIEFLLSFVIEKFESS
jgi:hypothetical protein